MCKPHFLYPLICWRTLGCFHRFAVVNNTAVNVDVHISVRDLTLHSFRYRPKSGVAGSCSRSVFSFLRNIQKTKTMASGPITSWEIDGETVETGSKITADGDCSHEIKRRLLLGRKVMTNLDGIFKRRDITLPTKVCLVKATVFPCGHVWMWELDCEESWAPKN